MNVQRPARSRHITVRPSGPVARPAGVRRPTAGGRPRLRPRRTVNWTAVASLLAALAAVAGVVFTGVSLQTTRAQTALTEQGQVTDRYGKAVDQLDRTGPEHLQGRLGAIYALERLARDSPRDQPTIIEVLSAFIRTTTPQATQAEQDHASTCPQQAIAPDIQAALTVLGRRDTTHDQTARIDLHSTCLPKADLDDASLARANMINVNLNDADLNGAHLASADLTSAHLGSSSLGGADLTRAGLHGADLRGADLTSAHLVGADLTSADLTGANLGGAFLRGVFLGGAHLVGADLTGANISNADLSGAHLRSAHLFGADLTSSSLSGAVLSGANLREAHLLSSDLSGADLNGADLRGSDLTGADHDGNTVVSGVVVSPDTKGVWW